MAQYWKEEKDLGIFVSEDLKWMVSAYHTGSKPIVQSQLSITYDQQNHHQQRQKNITEPLQGDRHTWNIVHLHGHQSPYHKKDKQLLERAQQRFTRCCLA